MRSREIPYFWALACGMFAACLAVAAPGMPQSATLQPQSVKARPDSHGRSSAPAKPSARDRFAARATAALETGLAAKGDWGLLIADAETGETLFEQNADKYF